MSCGCDGVMLYAMTMCISHHVVCTKLCFQLQQALTRWLYWVDIDFSDFFISYYSTVYNQIVQHNNYEYDVINMQFARCFLLWILLIFPSADTYINLYIYIYQHIHLFCDLKWNYQFLLSLLYCYCYLSIVSTMKVLADLAVWMLGPNPCIEVELCLQILKLWYGQEMLCACLKTNQYWWHYPFSDSSSGICKLKILSMEVDILLLDWN